MKKLISLIFLISFATLCLADSSSVLRTIKWKKISAKDGIDVFAPEDYSHDSGLVPIRFKTILNFDVARVLSTLADNKRKLEWMPRGKEAYIVERKSLADFTVYYRYDLPWPLADRDFVIRNFGRIDQASKMISVDLKSVENSKAPSRAESGAVRGTTYDGYTIISPLGKNKTQVEMALLNDFGGFIPKWLINTIQKKWPYKFMRNLNTQLEKKDIIINPDYIFE